MVIRMCCVVVGSSSSAAAAQQVQRQLTLQDPLARTANGNAQSLNVETVSTMPLLDVEPADQMHRVGVAIPRPVQQTGIGIYPESRLSIHHCQKSRARQSHGLQHLLGTWQVAHRGTYVTGEIVSWTRN